jgi:hypothetical protein
MNQGIRATLQGDNDPIGGDSGHWVRFNTPDRPNTLVIRRGGTYVLTTAPGLSAPNFKIFINAHDRPWRDLPANQNSPAIAEPVVLILNGLRVDAPNGAAIHSRRHRDALEIRVVDGTTNTLTDSATYAVVADPEDSDPPPEPSGTIFAQGDIRITGRGTLNITSRLNEQRWRRTGGAQGTATQRVQVRGRGIESRDTITINGGNINITSTDTAIHGRDGVTIGNGTFTLRAGNHGIRASNTSTTNPAFGRITINNGTFNIEHRNTGINAEHTLVQSGGIITRMENMDRGQDD